MKEKLFLQLVLLVILSSYCRPANTKVASVASFNTALSTAVPGDTITLANQTWTNVVLEFSGKNGTAALPIVLKAETFGRVIIAGNSNLRIGGNYLIVDGLVFRNAISSKNNLIEFRSSSGTYASYSRLTQTALLDCNPVVTTTSYIWVCMYGTHNRMDHCYLSGKNHDGPYFQVTRDLPDANYAQIDSNYFANRPNLGLNGQETVKIGSGTYSLYNSNTVVEYNLFEKCNGEIETVSNKSCENIIRYNTFLNNEGTITLRQGRRCQVYGNFFIGNGSINTGGIRVHGDDHKIFNNYFSGLRGNDSRSALSIENGDAVTDTTIAAAYFPVRRLLVAFNTFVNNACNINIGINGDGISIVSPDSVTFANNVIKGIAGSTQTNLFTLVDTATNTTYLSNIYSGSVLGISPVPAGFSNLDPLLSLQSDGFFRPAVNSPLIDAATGNYPAITTDMDGQLRQGISDIGADEVSSTNKTIKLAAPPLVGPKDLQVFLGIESKTNNNIPGNFELEQNFPNPFNPSTRIGFKVNYRAHISLMVENILGEQVAVLINEEKSPGIYNLQFNPQTYNLSSGVYFYRLTEGIDSITKKMVYLK